MHVPWKKHGGFVNFLAHHTNPGRWYARSIRGLKAVFWLYEKAWRVIFVRNT